MAAVIFSHQRCGSSNLLRFVEAATGLLCGMESLNAKTFSKLLPDWNTASYARFDAAVAETFSRWAVVKHIYGALSPDLDSRILDAPGAERLLLLYRENVAAAALSTLIARRIGAFGTSAEAPLGRIEAEEITAAADHMRRARRLTREMAQRTGKPLEILTYERLFSEDVAQRRARARRVLAFFGFTPEGEAVDRAFEQFLTPERKINSDTTYNHIENIDELRSLVPQAFE